MATFNFRSTAEKKNFTASGFLGVDFTSSPENTDMRRSPNAINIIRDTPGKNKRRNGYTKEYAFPDAINGIHIFHKDGVEKFLVHAGTELYLRENDTYTPIYSDMKNARSSSTVLNGQLIIIDGKKMLSYDGTTVIGIDENAYVPTVIIGRSPTGGGTLYEPINMVSRKRIEKFIANGNSKKYFLSADNISSVSYVKRRSASGEWVYLTFDIDYDYDSAAGTVTFYTAPAAPADASDNILICYNTYNSEYSNIINSCNMCTLYGVNGNMDRIFLTGCDKYPNRDYYCQVDDPTYWGDTWYSTMGKTDSPIVGYSIVSGCLAAHKAGEDSNANIILREGKIVNDEACFPVVGTYTSGSAIASRSFGMLDNEPVYLADDGINAITPSDVLGERFSQLRSYFLNGKLLKEENLRDASSVSYKGFYMLLVNEKMYILDGLQSVLTNGKPFSHRQYEGYFWENIPGKFLFTDGKTLYMAGKDNILYSFKEDYTDDGTPFETYWEFAEFFGDDFSRLKTITHIDLLVESGADKAVLEYCDKDGNWKIISEPGSLYSDKVLSKKIHIKDCTSIKFRIRNMSDNDFKINRIKISFINGRKIR